MRGVMGLVVAGMALAGCGYVGPPLPPALMIPVRIGDLRGVQRGDRILLEFTVPVETTEKVVLKAAPEIDLRVGENLPGGFDFGRWAERAKRIEVERGRSEGVIEIGAGEWVGRQVIVAVRAVGPSGRASEWSNLLLLRVQATPEAPVGVKAWSVGRGVAVAWSGPGTQWRVWRLGEGAKAPQELGVSSEPEWLDETAVVGQSYAYTVQQLLGGGERPAESVNSAAAELRHEDKQAPATPVGLQAIAGMKTVELSWDRNVEADLKGYQVYRGEGEAAGVKVGGVVDRPSFSDGEVASGKRYRYRVAAVDEAGNESEACAAVEVVAP